MYAFNILHANTDPNLLTPLRERLDRFAHAGIAVGYFFMSGLEAVADTLTGLHQVRTLVLQPHLVSRGIGQLCIPQRPATGNACSDSEIALELWSK